MPEFVAYQTRRGQVPATSKYLLLMRTEAWSHRQLLAMRASHSYSPITPPVVAVHQGAPQ